MTAKSKAELMREIRKRRKELGLIRREYWATEKQHKKIKKLLEES